jgi:hypothetical protein
LPKKPALKPEPAGLRLEARGRAVVLLQPPVEAFRQTVEPLYRMAAPLYRTTDLLETG